MIANDCHWRLPLCPIMLSSFLILDLGEVYNVTSMKIQVGQQMRSSMSSPVVRVTRLPPTTKKSNPSSIHPSASRYPNSQPMKTET